MLINHIKASQHSDSVELAYVARIVNEVKVHGFHSELCINLNREINNHDALIRSIEQIATRIGLRVTFNEDETICIFEDKLCPPKLKK